MIYTVFMPVAYWCGLIFCLSVMLAYGQEDLETIMKKKVIKGSYCFWVVRDSVCLTVHPSISLSHFLMHASVLKYHTWISHEKK